MRRIEVSGHAVTVGAGAIDSLGSTARAAAPAHRYALITDTNVAPLHGERAARSFGDMRPAVLTIPPGESEKTRARWAELTDRLLHDGFGRDSTIVALGGGVICDLAGFVAATYMRGIPIVQVPTSLLAMIDASVGGKTGVDTGAGKNLVGAFHRPAAVVVDPSLLRTLPVEHLRAGLAEAIKHGVIADAGYFESIEAALPRLLDDPGSDAVAELIARSIEIKGSFVDRDEREAGPRKALNFGHTIGHAVEQLSGYSLLHGEAVAIGMAMEARLGEAAGVTAPGTAARLTRCLEAAGLPTRRPASIAISEIIRVTLGDKKARRGRAEYALPARIGEMAGESTGYAIALEEDFVARHAE